MADVAWEYKYKLTLCSGELEGTYPSSLICLKECASLCYLGYVAEQD